MEGVCVGGGGGTILSTYVLSKEHSPHSAVHHVGMWVQSCQISDIFFLMGTGSHAFSLPCLYLRGEISRNTLPLKG